MVIYQHVDLWTPQMLSGALFSPPVPQKCLYLGFGRLLLLCGSGGWEQWPGLPAGQGNAEPRGGSGSQGLLLLALSLRWPKGPPPTSSHFQGWEVLVDKHLLPPLDSLVPPQLHF